MPDLGSRGNLDQIVVPEKRSRGHQKSEEIVLEGIIKINISHYNLATICEDTSIMYIIFASRDFKYKKMSPE